MRVLSIDGGGIRGIIPGMLLVELERRSGKRIHELFDLVAGTSTGGILALGLVCPKPAAADADPYSAGEMVDLYVEHGGRIFERTFWRKLPGADLFEEKYSAATLEQLLTDYFGAGRLSEVVTDVLLSAYEIERRDAFFFKSRKARVDPSYDFPLVDVARATSAAPTYFEPHKIQQGGDYYSLVDGGVFANNPTMCAIAESFMLHEGPERPDLVVASLGTGELTRRIPHDEATGFGLANWVRPIISVMMDGMSDSVCYQGDHILGDRHMRFQTRLDEGSDDMDNASRTNIRVLRLLAERMIEDNDARIDRLLELVA
ncbi:MAG: patatin-like phospholipase family protein [Gemmatimonadota bacterium]